MNTTPKETSPVTHDLRSQLHRSVQQAMSATAPTHLSGLLHQAMAAAGADDQELAAELVRNGALARIVELGTVDDASTREVLGYSPASFRAAISKTKSFPDPAVEDRRWALSDIQAYGQHRRNRRSS